MKNIKYQGQYLTLFEEERDGEIFERVIRKDGVVVYPIKDGKVLLIYEHRPLSGKTVWRFVTGLIDKEGYTPEQIAKEELNEEIGHDAETFTLFKKLEYRGIVLNDVYYFIAHNLFKLEPPIKNPDGDLIHDMKWVSLDKLYAMLDSGELLPSTEALIAVQILRSE